MAPVPFFSHDVETGLQRWQRLRRRMLRPLKPGTENVIDLRVRVFCSVGAENPFDLFPSLAEFAFVRADKARSREGPGECDACRLEFHRRIAEAVDAEQEAVDRDPHRPKELIRAMRAQYAEITGDIGYVPLGFTAGGAYRGPE